MDSNWRTWDSNWRTWSGHIVYKPWWENPVQIQKLASITATIIYLLSPYFFLRLVAILIPTSLCFNHCYNTEVYFLLVLIPTSTSVTATIFIFTFSFLFPAFGFYPYSHVTNLLQSLLQYRSLLSPYPYSNITLLQSLLQYLILLAPSFYPALITILIPFATFQSVLDSI